MPKIKPAAPAAKTNRCVTIRVDVAFWRNVKRFAIDHDTTITKLITDALRSYLTLPNDMRRPQ